MKQTLDSITAKVLRSPRTLGTILSLAQRIRPVARLGQNFFVFKHADVRTVLADTGAFEYGEGMRSKSPLGEFLVGMDDWPATLREKAIVRQSIEASERSRLTLALEQAWEGAALSPPQPPLVYRLERTGPGTPLDLVGDYVEEFLIRFNEAFFGVAPPADGMRSKVVSEQGRRLMAQWLRKVGSLVLLSPPASFGLQAVAERCAKELGDHLDQVIGAAQYAAESETESAPTILASLLQKHHEVTGERANRDFIRRHLCGLLLAANPTVIKSFVMTIVNLAAEQPSAVFDHEAADAGSTETVQPYARLRALASKNRLSDTTLRQAILEAMRFSPTFPLLSRTCPRHAHLQSPSAGSIVMNPGARVVVSPFAAMFDEAVFERNYLFSLSRPEDDYLHFGYGGHRCPGDRIAIALLMFLVRKMLSHLPAERIRVEAPEYDGPTVHRCVVKIDP
ncbi:MAG: cytochrome P450 [Burkholderiaceae bacterium]